MPVAGMELAVMAEEMAEVEAVIDLDMWESLGFLNSSHEVLGVGTASGVINAIILWTSH